MLRPSVQYLVSESQVWFLQASTGKFDLINELPPNNFTKYIEVTIDTSMISSE